MALLVLGGCAPDALDLAPPDPQTPAGAASPAAATSFPGFAVLPRPELAVLPTPPDADADKTYGLLDLIDVAERANPSTRIAWDQARQAVFTLIDTERWAVGNFKETDLAGLRTGDRSQVYVMSDPARSLTGLVSDEGFGVSPQEDASVGGLPSVPRSLNWVRIAQRFPVRIRLDRPPEDLMRIGASVVIIVDRH